MKITFVLINVCFPITLLANEIRDFQPFEIVDEDHDYYDIVNPGDCEECIKYHEPICAGAQWDQIQFKEIASFIINQSQYQSGQSLFFINLLATYVETFA